MRILLTGATGFIGNHILNTLDKNTTTLVIRDLEAEKKFTEAGWKTTSFKIFPRETDVVIHAAGTAGGTLEECISGNVLSTLDVLDSIKASSIPHLIYLSGAAIYGNVSEPAKESDLVSPMTPYGTSKLAAERIIERAIHNNIIESATIFRCNNIYGAGSDHGMMSYFIKDAIANLAINVDGDGSQIREPIFIDDVVSIIKKAVDLKKPGLHIYNVSGSEAKTLVEIGACLSQALEKNVHVQLSGKPGGLPHTLRLDISKSARELDWKPTTLLHEGIQKTIIS